jgi:hypothetical protein
MDLAQFRSDFPEFTSIVKYPDNLVTYWSDLATNFVDPVRWGNITSKAIELVTAHYLVIAQSNIASEAVGGPSGGTTGTISSKSVGSVSIAFDSTIASERAAGHWNQTSYGRQYIHLARMIGMGCKWV